MLNKILSIFDTIYYLIRYKFNFDKIELMLDSELILEKFKLEKNKAKFKK